MDTPSQNALTELHLDELTQLNMFIFVTRAHACACEHTLSCPPISKYAEKYMMIFCHAIELALEVKRFVYYDRDIARLTEQSRCEQENFLSLKNYTSVPEIVLTEIDMFTTNEHTLKDNNILYSLEFSRGIYFMVLSISAKKQFSRKNYHGQAFQCRIAAVMNLKFRGRKFSRLCSDLRHPL